MNRYDIETIPHINLYYTQLFKQFFTKFTLMEGKGLKVFILLAIFGWEFVFFFANPKGVETHLIEATFLSIILGSGTIAFLMFLGYEDYNALMKSFQNMINYCQDKKLYHFLDLELEYYENKRTIRELHQRPESDIYLFFKAMSFLHKNELDESLGIFEELIEILGDKQHVKFEVYFQIGQIFNQFGNKEKGTKFLLKALEGFKKNKYDEPCELIENILRGKNPSKSTISI